MPPDRIVLWFFTDLHASATGRSNDLDKEPPSVDIASGGEHLEAWRDMLASAAKDISGRNLRPDWILCAGDLSQQNPEKEIPKGLDFLAAIALATGVPSGRVVLAPGNHDVEFVCADAGNGTVQFYDLVAKRGFVSPRSVSSGAEVHGVAPFPIDSTALIGRTWLPSDALSKLKRAFPRLLRFVISKRVLARIERAFLKDLRHRAGSVSAKDFEQRLTGFISSLPDGRFPVVLSHHPVVPQPLHRADSDVEDTTVHATLFRRRLADMGVPLILQGHRHERSAHVEYPLSLELDGHETVVVGGPSLGYDGGAFTIIELERTRSRDATRLTAWIVPRDRVQPFAPEKWFIRDIVSPAAARCRTIRRILSIDTAGRTQIDHYFDDFASSVPVCIEIPLFPCGGDVAVEREVGICVGSRYARSVTIRTEETEGGINVVVQPEMNDRARRSSFVFRADAVGCHALTRRESQLMRGAEEHSDFETTAFLVPVATARYELTIRFPIPSSVPAETDVDVFVIPIAKFAPHNHRKLSELIAKAGAPISRSSDALSVTRWPAGCRLLVGVDRPTVGAVYLVRWRLWDPEPDIAKTGARKPPTHSIPPQSPRWPCVTTWADLAAAVRDKGRLSVDDLSFFGLNLIASIRELGGKEIEDAINENGFETALHVSDELLSVARPSHPCKIRPVCAVVPTDGVGWARYGHCFAYGHGTVGLAIRSGLIYARPVQSVPNALRPTYFSIVDGGPVHHFLLCAPIWLAGGTHPIAALSFGVYREAGVPPILRNQWRVGSLIDEALNLANARLEHRRSNLRFSVREKPPMSGGIL